MLIVDMSVKKQEQACLKQIGSQAPTNGHELLHRRNGAKKSFAVWSMALRRAMQETGAVLVMYIMIIRCCQAQRHTPLWFVEQRRPSRPKYQPSFRPHAVRETCLVESGTFFYTHADGGGSLCRHQAHSTMSTRVFTLPLGS